MKERGGWKGRESEDIRFFFFEFQIKKDLSGKKVLMIRMYSYQS